MHLNSWGTIRHACANAAAPYARRGVSQGRSLRKPPVISVRGWLINRDPEMLCTNAGHPSHRQDSSEQVNVCLRTK
jgi:hypothetical protein